MARLFTVTTATETAHLDAKGQGAVAFTVSNARGQPVRGRGVVVPLSPVEAAWYRLDGDEERDFEVGGTQQLTVRVAVPPGTSPGKRGFRLDMVSVANPDEDFTEGPVVAFEVRPPAAPRRFPLWIPITAAAALLVAVAGVVIWLSTGPKAPTADGPKAPTADFTATPLSGPAPLAVEFRANTDDPDHSLNTWVWDFGDTVTKPPDVEVKEPTTNHVFSEPGTYTVKLTVKSSKGGEASKERKDYIQVIDSPQADFSWSPVSDTKPLEVQFAARSSGNANQWVNAWVWEFGDGTQPSTDQNPTHMFKKYGTYNVSLTVKSSKGGEKTTSQDVWVGPPPVDHITCANNAAVVMSFRVDWDGGKSGDTDAYPVKQTRTIDLNALNIPDGTEVFPVVDPKGGSMKPGDKKVVFRKGARRTAMYEVEGDLVFTGIKVKHKENK
jgi:PKD repeat protein